jgi:hypothetical protein
MSTNSSHTTAIVQHKRRGLVEREVSAIEKAAEATTGCWSATTFDCGCCGRTTTKVALICEAVDGPSFEFSRDGSKIRLTTTWIDGEDYYSKHPSLPSALREMNAAISEATDTCA